MAENIITLIVKKLGLKPWIALACIEADRTSFRDSTKYTACGLIFWHIYGKMGYKREEPFIARDNFL
jgi:hypothetical protein